MYKPSNMPVCDCGTLCLLTNARVKMCRISDRKVHKFTWLLKSKHYLTARGKIILIKGKGKAIPL